MKYRDYFLMPNDEFLEAIEKDLISLSKGAEILNKSNSDMRKLVNSWKKIDWNVLKR